MSLYEPFNLWLSGISPRKQRPPLVRYGIAVLLVGLSTMVGLWFRPAFYHSPYLSFYAAILISLLCGGFGPGIVSTLLSALLVNYWFQPPYGQVSYSLLSLGDGTYFCLSFGFICWLIDTRQKVAAVQIRTQIKLLDIAAAPVIMCDEEDRIVYWNKGAESVYGWTSDEAIGKGITELLHTVFPEPIEDIKSQLTTVGLWNGVLRRTRKDGSEVFVVSSSTWRRTGRHRPTRLESDHDCTEQRNAEERLRASEDRFRTLANAMPQLAWIAHPDGSISWYNRRWYEYTGAEAAQMEGWGWQSVHDPSELPKVMERWKASIDTSEPFEMVFPLRGVDGVFRPFLTRVIPVKGPEGKVVGWFGTNTDISSQKQVEAELRKSKERLDLAVEVADMGEWELDLESHIASHSLLHDRIFGYKSLFSDWTYERFLSHVLPELRTEVEREFKASMATGTWDFETRIRRVDGEVRWIWVRGRHRLDEMGQPTRMFGIVLDITERKRAETERQESEERFHSFMDNNPAIAWAKDEKGRHVYLNQTCQKRFGVKLDDWFGKTDFELWPPEIARAFRKNDEAVMAAGEPMEVVERAINPDGTTSIWRNLKFTFADARGRMYVGGVGIDITESEQVAAAMRLDEERLQLAMRVADMGIWELQLPARLVIWSPEVFNIFGVPHDTPQPSLEDATRFTHPEDRSLVEEQTVLLLAGEPIQVAHRIIWPDGQVRWIEVFAKTAPGEIGQPVRIIGVCRDVTERHQLEAQLRQAQKMEAVGRLAGGVAHDFNNMLMVITGYGELLKEEIESDESLRYMIEEILKASARAASLTHQLLAFSRKQVLIPCVLDLNSVLADLSTMLPRLIGEDIDLNIVPGKSLGRVKADASQMQEVIFNLVVNARDAMPDGGRLTIETANAKLDGKDALLHGVELKPGPYVMVAVADSGIGMDRATEAHIFEPFFTTKGLDKGTGLGLSIVYGVVKQSDGFIWVFSEPGQGTTFKIYLPCVEEEKTNIPATNVPWERDHRSETILLVEDEQGVREAISRFLRAQGYTVLEAHNPSIAIGIAQEKSVPIHLLMTDIIMPEMNGLELAKRLSTNRPEMSVLYISGYADCGITGGVTIDAKMNFLQKPFALDVLGHKLSDILAR